MRARRVPLALFLVACSPGGEALPRLGLDIDDLRLRFIGWGLHGGPNHRIATSSWGIQFRALCNFEQPEPRIS